MTGIAEDSAEADDSLNLLDLALLLAQHWTFLVLAPLCVGLAALGGSYLVAPTFTARTSFLPPQQAQSAAAGALASLGALSALAGAGGGLKSQADQHVALLQSVTVQDRLIDTFGLMQAYESKFRFEARKELASNVRIALGKKDGLITIEVDDTSPQRAAEMANRHIDELRRVTSELALSEAQQRRLFFEGQLKQTRDKLGQAQLALQNSGFNQSALRAEPKAAAENYARMKAEVTAAEVRLQTLRSSLVDSAPEVQTQLVRLQALRAQLGKLEGSLGGAETGDYVSKFREFKYQETLFDLFSRQYELARVDESREGALIQVVDIATLPEHKSRPRRAFVALVSTGIAVILALAFVVLRHGFQRASTDPATDRKLNDLRNAFWRKWEL